MSLTKNHHSAFTLVIPCRDVQTNESLRYSLRAWHVAGNVLGTKIRPLVVGTPPTWYMGDYVLTAQARLTGDVQWRVNFPRALDGAIAWAEENDIQDVLWTADDIFPLELSALSAWVREDQWPTYVRKMSLRAYLSAWERTGVQTGYTKIFLRGMTGQHEIIEALDLERRVPVKARHDGSVWNADTHLPHKLNISKLKNMLEELRTRWPNHLIGHFRAVYGALWPGTYVVPVRDPKVVGASSAVGTTRLEDGTEWISTSPGSWKGRVGESIRRRFTEPSPWESTNAPTVRYARGVVRIGAINANG